jgi:hypothetical protein
MKRLMKKLEDMMVAITFAEAGEHELSRELMGVFETGPEKKEKPEKGKETAAETT